MNLKYIRNFTKNALLIVLTMIVTAGATGLSYKVHLCHGSVSGIAFFTELGIQLPVSCGCKDDAGTGKLTESANSHVLTKSGCCSNISFFNKLNIETTVNYFPSLVLIQPSLMAAVINIAPNVVSKKENFSFSDFKFRPPPLAGRKLVLFLSQQRIPLISYNC